MNAPFAFVNQALSQEFFLRTSGRLFSAISSSVNRSELEHVIRAAAAHAGTGEVIIIGSQAILGTYPDAPSELLRSIEADVFPKDRPADSILIDGAMGELSTFHQTFGYYAHGV